MFCDSFKKSEQKTNEKIIIDPSVHIIVQTYEVSNQSTTVRLLKLRNLVQNSQWIGDWSPNSSLWTPELKQKVGYMSLNDERSFFMSFDDYFTMFSQT